MKSKREQLIDAEFGIIQATGKISGNIKNILYLEDLVNEWIKAAIPVEHVELKKEDAKVQGAEAMFIEKYGDIVSVYKIGDKSLELCGGPHVSNTSELGHFKIQKEESSSSGIRRIKAILDYIRRGRTSVVAKFQRNLEQKGASLERIKNEKQERTTNRC